MNKPVERVLIVAPVELDPYSDLSARAKVPLISKVLRKPKISRSAGSLYTQNRTVEVYIIIAIPLPL